MQGQKKAPLKPLDTKKIVIVGRGQNQETTEARGHGVKALAHFLDQYHQLPEESWLKWIVGVTDFRAMPLVLNTEVGRARLGWNSSL